MLQRADSRLRQYCWCRCQRAASVLASVLTFLGCMMRESTVWKPPSLAFLMSAVGQASKHGGEQQDL